MPGHLVCQTPRRTPLGGSRVPQASDRDAQRCSGRPDQFQHAPRVRRTLPDHHISHVERADQTTRSGTVLQTVVAKERPSVGRSFMQCSQQDIRPGILLGYVRQQEPRQHPLLEIRGRVDIALLVPQFCHPSKLDALLPWGHNVGQIQV